MTTAKTTHEDVDGAIDALERRAAHLATIVHPTESNRPHRTAHWRDEVELRSLRLGVKALKEKRGRLDDENTVAELLADVLDVLDGNTSPKARRLAQRIEERLDAAD